MRFLLSTIVTLGVCSTMAAQAPAAAPKAQSGDKPATTGIDKKKIEAYLRHVELLPETMAVKVGDPTPSAYAGYLNLPVEVVTPNGVYALRYVLSADGKHLLKGTLFDTTKLPFEDERKSVKTAGQANFGPAGAPVTMVVYSDFQCPNCKETGKQIHENIPKTFPNDVRVFFKDFPLDTIHPWARAAAIGGRCVFRDAPASFWSYHDWVYEHQAELTAETFKAKALGWAETNKLDAAKLGQCIDSKATEKEVDRSIAEGRALGISGTPTIFINGRPLTGALPWQNLEAVLKIEIEYAKKAAKDEKCCEVTIPSLVK